MLYLTGKRRLFVSRYIGSFVIMIALFFSDIEICNAAEIKFLCARTEFQLPGTKTCTHTRVFDHKLDQAFKDANQRLAETRFELLNAIHNGVSGSIFHFPSGRKHVYRSAMLMGNIPCLYELINERGVRHIVNIANPISYNTKPWTEREKKYFFEMVPNPLVSKYVEISDLYYKYRSEKEKELAYKKIAQIIHSIEDLKGTVLLHCLGGEQKAGIVYGIMQKCMNKVPMSLIDKEYKCHTAWKNEQDVGGYRQRNIDFIKNFPCKKLLRNSKTNVGV